MKIYEANSEGSFPILLIFYAAKLIHLPRMPLRVNSGPFYNAELAKIRGQTESLAADVPPCFQRTILYCRAGHNRGQTETFAADVPPCFLRPILYTAELATIGAAGFSVVGSAMETAASCSGSC